MRAEFSKQHTSVWDLILIEQLLVYFPNQKFVACAVHGNQHTSWQFRRNAQFRIAFGKPSVSGKTGTTDAIAEESSVCAVGAQDVFGKK